MIHHVVMWRLREEARRTDLAPVLTQVERNLAAMRATIPGLLRLQIGSNASAAPDAADLLLYGVFDSWQALQGYEVHPLHDALRGLIGPLRSERRVVDYETCGP